MAVGTNIGRVYDGQQGTGFATVLDYDPRVDLAAAQMDRADKAAQAEARLKAQKAKALSHEQMMKAKPDWWHTHDKEVSELWQGAQDFGGAAIANGVDPFSDTSETSVQFRKLLDKTTLYAKASEEKRKNWEKFKNEIYLDSEKSKKIKNLDEIVGYFNNPSIIEEVENGIKMPKPVFATPMIDTQKAVMNVISTKAGGNKDYIPSMDDAYELAGVLQSNPVYTDGFDSANSVMKQNFDKIKSSYPDIYEGYVTRAAKTKGVDPYTQYLAETVYGAAVPTKTTNDIADGIKIGSKETSIEDGDVTIGGKRPSMSDKEIEDLARVELANKIGTVQREVDAGLYGNPDWTLDKNMDAAVKHVADLVKKKQDTKYTKREDEGGKARKEAESARQYWDEAFQGKHGPAAQREAQDFLKSSIQGADKAFVNEVIPGAFNLPGGEGMVGPVDEAGVQLKVKNEEGDEEVINIPISGTTSESRKALYDRAVKDRGKVFEVPEGGFDIKKSGGGFDINKYKK